MPEVVPLLLGGFAATLATVAAVFGAVAWWRSDGRRLSVIERQLVTSLSAISGRIGEIESIVQRQRLEFSGLVEEAEQYFERADNARKRAQGDRSRAERALETTTAEPAEVAEADLPRADMLRLVAARMAER